LSVRRARDPASHNIPTYYCVGTPSARRSLFRYFEYGTSRKMDMADIRALSLFSAALYLGSASLAPAQPSGSTKGPGATFTQTAQGGGGGGSTGGGAGTASGGAFSPGSAGGAGSGATSGTGTGSGTGSAGVDAFGTGTGVGAGSAIIGKGSGPGGLGNAAGSGTMDCPGEAEASILQGGSTGADPTMRGSGLGQGSGTGGGAC
jgi:hypothetical protein